MLKNELQDFASKWEKLKLKLPETYLVQEEDNEDDEEGEITLNNENQQQKIEQCKKKKNDA